MGYLRELKIRLGNKLLYRFVMVVFYLVSAVYMLAYPAVIAQGKLFDWLTLYEAIMCGFLSAGLFVLFGKQFVFLWRLLKVA